MDRAERKAEIEFLTDCLKKTNVAVCADYRGLTVAQVTVLRKELRAAGAGARVVKNTLAKRSIAQAFGADSAEEAQKFQNIFKGPIFLMYSFKDPVGPTKVLVKHAKNIECLSVKGAFFEGKFLDEKRVLELSNMPGKEEVLSMLLRLISTPATNLVRILQAPGEQFVRVLGAQSRKLAGEG
jgi:large subunit ribosomal protein L10